MTSSTSIMVRSRLMQKATGRGFSIYKLVNEFYKQTNEHPQEIITFFGDANVAVTVAQNSALTIIREDHAVSLTFNNWLENWLESKHGKRYLKLFLKNKKSKRK